MVCSTRITYRYRQLPDAYRQLPDAGLMLNDLPRCTRCPRLAQHLCTLRERLPQHHNAPVGSWGSVRPRLLIVGLAPGLHGANRTGRAFVGDASGRTLFEALYASGWATSTDPFAARLVRARITNVVKCLPPENRPTTEELRTCASWLAQELDAFLPSRRRSPRAVLCLGTVAYHTVRSALRLPAARFVHASAEEVDDGTWLHASYHPSRQNVNTGRLTLEMLVDVLHSVRDATT